MRAGTPSTSSRHVRRRSRAALWTVVAVVSIGALMALSALPQLGSDAPSTQPIRVSAGSTPSTPPSATVASLNSSANATWQLVNTTGGPTALAGFGMVYDANLGAIVVFGGCTSGSYFNLSCSVTNSTWTYSNGTWTHLSLTVAPAGRVAPAMAYDPNTGDVLLFGGGSGYPYYLSYHDTWEFNGTGWSEVVTGLSPPPSDAGVSMVYDAAVGADVLFDTGELYQGGPFLNQTWTFASGNWTLVASGVGPEPRGVFMMSYDATLGAAIVFGGNECDNQTGLCPNQADTWAYANGTWANVSTAAEPPPRNSGAFGYDPTVNGTLLFSGHVGFDYYDDAWVHTAKGWTALSAPVGPTPSEGAGLTYDAADHEMILFGGYQAANANQTAFDIYFNQTWALVGTLTAAPVGYWTYVNATGAPTGRAGFGMVYDPTIGAVVMFGGCTSGHSFNDSCNATNQTWTYAHGHWNELFPPVAPSARTNPAMTYDPQTEDVLLFGGASGYPSYLTDNDTWEFNGTNWTELHPSQSPETGGFSVKMTYDAASAEVVLFDSGEVYHGGPYLNDTWTFSGGQWTRALHGVGPSPRSGESIDYDATLGDVVLFGGNQCSNVTGICPNFQDTWTFSSGAWTNQTASASPTAPSPPPRNGAPFAYDPALNASLLVSGHFDQDYYSDVWTYSASGWTSLAPGGSAPPPSEGAGLVYDAADQQMLLFGGYENVGGPFGGAEIYFNSLWSFGEIAPGPVPVVESLTASSTAVAVGNEALIVADVQSPSPVAYSYFGLPTGCVSSDVSTLPCTPTETGNFTVALQASNEVGTTPFAILQLDVGDVATPAPTIESFTASPVTITLGQSTTLTAVVSSTLTVAYQYSGLPAGCASGDTASLFCTPTQGGTFTVGLLVTDTAGRTAQGTLTLQVSGGTVPAPVIESFLAAPATFTEGNATSLTAVVSSAVPVTYVYAGLPTGCSTANTSILLCRPTASGNFSVLLTVTNSVHEAARALADFTVVESSTPAGAPVIESFSASVPSFVLGNSTTLTAVVDSSTAVRYSYAGLPAGCQSADLAVLACVPHEAGNFTVTLTVSNSSPGTAEASLLLSVGSPVSIVHKGPPTGPLTGGSGPSLTEYVLLGALVGAVGLGSIAVAAQRARSQLRREGEALAREMLAPHDSEGPAGRR
jgi:hypothetical protein